MKTAFLTKLLKAATVSGSLLAGFTAAAQDADEFKFIPVPELTGPYPSTRECIETVLRDHLGKDARIEDNGLAVMGDVRKPETGRGITVDHQNWTVREVSVYTMAKDMPGSDLLYITESADLDYVEFPGPTLQLYRNKGSDALETEVRKVDEELRRCSPLLSALRPSAMG